MYIKKSLFYFLILFSPVCFADSVSIESNSQIVKPFLKSVRSGVGVRAASEVALGKARISPVHYVGAAIIGFAIITNNNDNDGQPATFTGGSGSNMASGG